MTSRLKTILLAGFTAGTLDIIAAIVLLGNRKAVPILKYIASGVFGKEAFAGGTEMAVLGLLFHYTIAFSFAIAYFLLFPSLPPLLKKHKLLSGLLYGILVWCVMNLVVVPMTNVSRGPIKLESALLNMGILMVCIGLPISLIVERYYASKK
ncbi:DUF1440 domain-containing protein [Larkinella terrae]|uniref:DUF1440 domain-containing protein n=1 Tax=Larkinella terrae TaxID=2025311 RepID=A0A7K0EKH2_9BACT|nr:DUF1440 domain-containing protein [Larkinella terrae]MRS61958.1 DUF1440 domain-containing protein [Larkinella terrae]